MRAASARRVEGSLADGGAWAIDVPENFTGSVCLYSAGYGGASPGRVDVSGDESTRRILLERGFALAGSRTASEGWIVGDALLAQVQTLEEVRRILGTDVSAIAWGHSMGGLIAAGLAERAADLIDGAVPFCASVAGAVPMLNQGLDAAFALAVLCSDGAHVELVDVSSDDLPRLTRGRELVERARATAAGRAAIALAAALAQIPPWTVDNMFTAGDPSPEPAPGDTERMLANQAAVLPYVAFSPRRDLERRSGGNFSWNTGIDYARQLAISGLEPLVRDAYAREGADLSSDLDRLAHAPRIAARDEAVSFMEDNLTPDGSIDVPVLNIAITGDFAPTVTQSSAYRDVVAEAGRSESLEQLFIHAPGHCASLTAAEVVAGLETMSSWLATTSPGDLSPMAMNARARDVAAAHGLDGPAPAFIEFTPGAHVRPHPRAERRSARTLGEGVSP